MKTRYIYYALIIAIVAVFGYLVTSNLYITIGCGLLYAIFFFFLADRKLNRYFERNRVTLECYSFIDSYVIGLSAKKSLKGAFESATTSISLQLKEQLTLLENMDEEEKIDALLRYFELDIYKMFCDIIHLFSENGGDILRMSSLLLN